MEDPAREAEGLVRALVDKPTLRRQDETLRRYFTDNVEFYHLYINTNMGLRTLIAIYQMAQLLLNYSGVVFHNASYDKVKNTMAIRMTVFIRPWLLLGRTTPLQLFTLLEFEDVVVNDKVLKKVKVQRDYFIRSPILQLIPGIGEIYNSETIRFILGNTLAAIFQLLQALIMWILPPKIWHGWFGLYSHDVAFHGQ